MTVAAAQPGSTRARPVGLIAMIVAILCFSGSSTLVKQAGIPGPTIAFWRLVLASLAWTVILRATEHRSISRADLRKGLVPGIAFGLNITCFFTAITHTTVANAEFIGALSPLIVVPLGAFLFHERLDPRALMFGLVSFMGLGLVLFAGASGGGASWLGNAFSFIATGTWAAYLTTSRTMRATMSVAAIMASAMPIAALTVLPIASYNGDIADVTWRGAGYIVGLTVLTGVAAHGLVVFAQHHMPMGTISIMQVSQPALAALWSVWILHATLTGVQVLGMALVITGIVLVTVLTQRRRLAAEAVPLSTG